MAEAIIFYSSHIIGILHVIMLESFGKVLHFLSWIPDVRIVKIWCRKKLDYLRAVKHSLSPPFAPTGLQPIFA